MRAPGLDGVRALAVLAVMAFHEGMGAAPGGFLGVDVFFVLSGYLITDLLVVRYERTGNLGLRGFWTRRARRLLPALGAVLVAVTAGVAVIEPGQLPALRPALAAAVTYSSNWYQALHHVSYFATFGPPPPLDHLWSLAIEEQFYLAWPLILILVLTRSRRRLVRASVAWSGAAASAVLMALLYVPGASPSRVYYGTGTHSSALLIGAALALTWPLASLTTAPRYLVKRLDAVGIAGLAVLAWAVGHFSGTDPVVYPAGLIIAALAAAALTAAATAPGVVSSLLALPPLRWLGIRSYGIYLWHWPVIALAAAVTGPGYSAPWLWGTEAGVAVMLAAASWRWIERPILRDGFRATCRRCCQVQARSIIAARHSPMRALPTLGAAAVLCLACTAGYGVLRPSPVSGLQRQVALGEQVSARTRALVPAQPFIPAQPITGAAVPTRGTAPAAGTVPPAATPRRAHQSARSQVSGSQVTAIGDSVMLASAQQLAQRLPGIYIDAKVSRQMSAGLSVVGTLAASGKLRDVVVVGLGTNGTVTAAQMRDLLGLIGPRRKLVLINTFEARPWEHEVNNLLAATARHHRNVVLANWLKTIEHRTPLLWGDGVHPRPSGARLYARMVAAAVRAARGRHVRAQARTSRPGPAPGPVTAGGSLTPIR